jgi:Ca2+-binding EF-hand superfamily protein
MEVVAHTLNPGQVKELKDLFIKFDKDMSGEIKVDELQVILKDHPQFTDGDLNTIFQGIDVEDSGTIKYHEFLAATLQHQNITDENLRIAFEKISNRTGFITPADLSDLMGSDGSAKNVQDLLLEVGMGATDNIDLGTFRRIMKGENASGQGEGLLDAMPYKAAKYKVDGVAMGIVNVGESVESPTPWKYIEKDKVPLK